jgi:hypothetical protein
MVPSRKEASRRYRPVSWAPPPFRIKPEMPSVTSVRTPFWRPREPAVRCSQMSSVSARSNWPLTLALTGAIAFSHEY